MRKDMKNKKIKRKLLTAIIVVVIIIIIAIIALVISLKKAEKENIIPPIKTTEDIADAESEENTNQEINISEDKYYMLEDIVTIYYTTINKNSYRLRDGSSTYEEESTKERISNIISKEYIEKNNITIDNIYDYLPELEESVTFMPQYINVEEGMEVDKYFVSGILIYLSDTDKECTKVNLFVNIDNKNETFSIEPILTEVTDITDVQINNEEEPIEDKTINKYTHRKLQDEEKSKRKLNTVKLLLQRKSKELYDMLDDEYRNKKFGSYEAYVQYIDSNYEKIQNMKLTKYSVTQEDGYTQYVCLDNYGKYYIFRNANVNDITILLDKYTVNLPEFLEKYEKANEREKVGLNIERFISAINDRDYKFAYDKLDEIFKQNNMPTQEDFENFVKANMYENNTLEHKTVEKQGNTFVYELNLKDADDNLSNTKPLTVIMQLKNITDFVMSFSIE